MRQWQHKVDNTAPASQGVLTAAEDNARGFELDNAVTQTGIGLDAQALPPDADSRLNMMAEAVCRAASGGVFGIDTGTINTVVLQGSGSYVVPKALFGGMQVLFFSGNGNNGPSTLNAFGIGGKPFLDQFGQAMQGSETVAGLLAGAIYDTTALSGAGAWKLFPWANMRTSPTLDLDPIPPSKPYSYKINNTALTAIDIDAQLNDFATEMNPHINPTDWVVGFHAGGDIIKMPVSAFITTPPNLFCLSGGAAGTGSGGDLYGASPPTYPVWSWTQQLTVGVWEVRFTDLVVSASAAPLQIVLECSFDNGITWSSGDFNPSGASFAPQPPVIGVMVPNVSGPINSTDYSAIVRFTIERVNNPAGNLPAGNLTTYAVTQFVQSGAGGAFSNSVQSFILLADATAAGQPALATPVHNCVMPKIRIALYSGLVVTTWGSPAPSCCRVT